MKKSRGSRKLQVRPVQDDLPQVGEDGGYEIPTNVVAKENTLPRNYSELIGDMIANDRMGVPNWREASPHGLLAELNDVQFRWEFLRRSPRYRQVWGATCKEPKPQSRIIRLLFVLSSPLNPRLSAEFLEVPSAKISHGVVHQ